MCQINCITEKKKYKHINYVERRQIERWYNKERKSKKEISILLDKSERTIRREIKRGIVYLASNGEKEYSADKAEKRYQYNLEAKGPELKIGNDYELVEYIEQGIKKERKSPEILIEEIERKGMQFKVKVCAKTIRNTIKLGTVFNIKAKDMIYKKKYKEKNKEKRVCNKVPAEKSIEYRPKEANRREEYGHWEGDLVIGKVTKGAVLFTLTERKTREEIIMKIGSKETKNIAKAFDKLERKYGRKFYQKFKTITFDNGAEFRGYEGIEKAKRRKGNRFKIYYAHPYCSGERGSNENNNRLIRRFIPKGTSINNISEEFIQWIEDWINNLPRPMFKYKTSLEVA
jgi:Transposase and inactivated derivatives, IS30 family